ncbi:MAG: hemerythrin domain-containing protein [Roseateles sp.]|nr:MAG: hemerythrin domain-containing protein [Roseateles sp.]
MSSPLLHAGPAVGFDTPFEMLDACHERVRRTLDLLQRLQAHVAQHGADEQARSAAADVLRYFDIAAPLHHQDEELHVLPRLRAQGLGELADQLQADHDALHQRWQVLRGPLLALQDGRPEGLAQADCAGLAQHYARHMVLEDGTAFAAARQGLDAPALAAMGAEMAARRRG